MRCLSGLPGGWLQGVFKRGGGGEKERRRGGAALAGKGSKTVL